VTPQEIEELQKELLVAIRLMSRKTRALSLLAGPWPAERAAVSGGPRSRKRFGARYRFCRGAGGAGVPVVAGASSGVQVIALRSYLNPLALLSASFVEFMTRYHLLLSLVVVRTRPVRSMGPSGPLPDDGLSWQCLAPALCQSEYYLVLSRCPNLRGNVIGLESVSEIWRRRG
jgi:hypothetical protein